MASPSDPKVEDGHRWDSRTPTSSIPGKGGCAPRVPKRTYPLFVYSDWHFCCDFYCEICRIYGHFDSDFTCDDEVEHEKLMRGILVRHGVFFYKRFTGSYV